MPKKTARALPRSRSGERLHHDGQRGREHDGTAGALHDPEGDDPRLGQAPFGVRPHMRGRAGEDDDAEHHHPPVADGVGQAAAEGEERGQGRAGRR